MSDSGPVTPRAVRRLAIVSALPFLGFVLFVIGGILALVTFSHNGSPLECSGTFVGTPGCAHHSYLPAIVLIVVGVAVLIGGGMFASYYAARHVGLPIINTLVRRRPPVSPPEA